MTDLVVAVRLTATDGGLVGQLQLSKKEVDGLAGAEKGAAAAAGELATSTGRVTRETREHGAAAGAAARSTRDQAGATQQLGAAQAGATANTRQLTQAQQASQLAARQNRAAYQQLGFQVQDVFASFASGMNPLVILAQQGGQTASALTGMGGAVGRVASFLAGPWGAALFGATTVAGLLATELIRGAGAADTMKQAQFDLGQFIDLTTGKLREQISATIALAEAQGQAEKLKEERDKYAASRAQLLQRTRAGVNPAFVGTEVGVAEIPSSVSSAGRARVLELADAYEKGAINVDRFSRELRALGRADPTVRSLSGQLLGLAGNTQKAAIAGQNQAIAIARLRVAAGEATEAERRLAASAQKTAEANTTLIEAEARLAAATDDVARAQANLEIVRAKGRDAAKEGGAAADQYRRELVAAETALDSAQAAERAAAARRTATAKATREAAKDVRELAAAERELAQLRASLNQAFDPATAARDRFDQRLKDIDRLKKEGLDDDTAAKFTGGAIDELSKALAGLRDGFLRETAPGIAEAINAPLVDATDLVEQRLVDAGRAGGRAFRDEGVEAAQAIAQIFGGKVGDALGQILGVISGLDTGNFNSVGGPAGGLLTLLAGGGARDRPKGGLDRFLFDLDQERERALGGGGFEDGLREVFGEFTRDLKNSFNFIFGENGVFPARLEKSLGRVAGSAAIAAQVGDLVGGSKGARIGGAIGGGLSAAAELTKGTPIGGALASVSAAVPQIGAAIAVADLASSALNALGLNVDKELFAVSPLGAIAKALFGGQRRGSATIGLGGNGLEVASTRGNSATRIEAASGIAGTINDALNKIAEAFGGAVTGSPSLSVGVRDGNYRLDPTGRGITKTKNGAIDFGQDAAALVTAATAEAIRDGVITGLSAKVAAALQSSPDLDKAIREALKVEELETLLDPAGEIAKSFRDFERQAAERVRIAKKYGFDLVKIEELSAKERAARFEAVVKERTGALTALLEDLAFGGLGEGTLADQRKRLLAERSTAEADARAGKDGAADRLAAIDRKLIEVTKEGFGTAGPELASTIANARSSAEAIVKLENERVKAAADATKATNVKLDQANSLANESNAILAEHTAILRQIASRTGASAPAGGGGRFLVDVARSVNF